MTVRTMFTVGLITVASIAAAAVARAEEGGPEAQAPLEEVTVSSKYLATGASSAMKLDLPVRDTPFSVASYTESFMQAVETTNVSDLYKYMTGIQRAGATAFRYVDQGFRDELDRPELDHGGRAARARGRFASPPTISTDHVEWSRACAVLVWSGAAGGIREPDPKKPSAHQGRRAGP